MLSLMMSNCSGPQMVVDPDSIIDEEKYKNDLEDAMKYESRSETNTQQMDSIPETKNDFLGNDLDNLNKEE